MHELGMCQAVLQAVEQRADGRKVQNIGVRAGEDLAVVPEVFEQGLQVLALGGVAEGVTAEVETVPGDELTLVWLRYREPGGRSADDPEVHAAGAATSGGS